VVSGMNGGPVLYASASALMLATAWLIQRVAWARRLKAASSGNSRRGTIALRLWFLVLALALIGNALARGYGVDSLLSALIGLGVALLLALARTPLVRFADWNWREAAAIRGTANRWRDFSPAFVDIMIASICGWSTLVIVLSMAGAT
jgi:hypothetical protein